MYLTLQLQHSHGSVQYVRSGQGRTIFCLEGILTRYRVLPPLDTPRLTPAEARILKLAHDGHTDAEICTMTGLVNTTIKSYLRRAREKGQDAVYRILNAKAR